MCTVLKSLDEEVAERACSRLLRLERENQTLRRTVEELKGTREPSEEHRRDAGISLKVSREESRIPSRYDQIETYNLNKYTVLID